MRMYVYIYTCVCVYVYVYVCALERCLIRRGGVRACGDLQLQHGAQREHGVCDVAPRPHNHLRAVVPQPLLGTVFFQRRSVAVKVQTPFFPFHYPSRRRRRRVERFAITPTHATRPHAPRAARALLR